MIQHKWNECERKTGSMSMRMSIYSFSGYIIYTWVTWKGKPKTFKHKFYTCANDPGKLFLPE